MSTHHQSRSVTTITPALWADLYQDRDPMGHKGTFGSVGIVGGASGMTGAALLAGRSALKAGAGRVYVFLAQEQPEITVDFVQPELMLRNATEALEQFTLMDAIAVGCGMGQQPHAITLLQKLLGTQQAGALVIDADALNAVARGDVQAQWDPTRVVLTPHPTEAARLLHTETATVQQDRAQSARALAERYHAWVVLKGHNTLIASPDGTLYQNPTGDVSLATAGTGDVLTGLIASLLAQGYPMLSAVCGGVWLHGAAGQLLRRTHGGPIGHTASEVIEAIRLLRNNRQQLLQR